MFISRNFVRTLKVVVSGLAILSTVTFQASGQSEGQYPTSQDEIARGINTGWDVSVEWEKGITAYQSGKLDEAILHFRNVEKVSPYRLLAKMYLGTALAQKVAPG